MIGAFRLWISVAVACVAATLLVAPAVAHEHREIADGKYEVTVGFLDEPAFVNEKNGLSLRITSLEGGATPPGREESAGSTPVEGLANTLIAEVIYGDQSMKLELEPVFGDPGLYQGIFFPTATGAYTFRISGEIEGTAIDEEFTSGPETFSEVEPIEPLQFPRESSSVDVEVGFPAEIVTVALGIGAAGIWIARRGVTRQTC
jgi:hypothetical protein